MSELLGKSDSLENAQPTLLQAYQPLPQKEPGHACKGEDRCCGGCRNPKRPVAPAAEGIVGTVTRVILSPEPAFARWPRETLRKARNGVLSAASRRSG